MISEKLALSLGQFVAIAVSALAFVAVTVLVIHHRWVNYLNRRRVADFYSQMCLVHPAHTYDRLPDSRPFTIRLIELLPAEDESHDLHIRLQTVSLLDPQRQSYEAISYCWGDPHFVLPLFCGGESLLWVTQNLHLALLRLRQSDRSRLLWADAVCINQTDDEEKSRQVQMMGDIYRNADRVLVWLGKEADASGLLETFIPQLLIAKELKVAAQDESTYMGLGSDQMKAYCVPSLLFCAHKYSALRKMVERPWFRRVWIIQEVVLAREVIFLCGSWSLPSRSLIEAWRFVSMELQLDQGFNALDGKICGVYLESLIRTATQVSSGNQPSLPAVLVSHSQSQASDPRDKVFALMGVTKNSADIQIDYGKSVTEVFQDTAFHIMSRDQNLDILSLAAVHSHLNDLPIPSWAPDWRLGKVAQPLVPNEHTLLGFNATLGSAYAPLRSPDGVRIRLSGYELDSIMVTSLPKMSYMTMPRIWKISEWHADEWTLAQWAGICDAYTDKVYKLTGEAMIDVFRQTLVLGTYPVGTSELTAELKSHIEWRELKVRIFGLMGLPALLRTFLPLKILSALLLLPFSVLEGIIFANEDLGKQSHWGRMTGSINSGRRMVTTTQGYVGIACGDVKVDDKMMLIEGGNVPYVLRRTSKDGVYALVGDAYVHGHMYGREWNPERCRPMWLI